LLVYWTNNRNYFNDTTNNCHLHTTHSRHLPVYIYPVPRQCHLTLQVADISCTAHNNVQRRNLGLLRYDVVSFDEWPPPPTFPLITSIYETSGTTRPKTQGKISEDPPPPNPQKDNSEHISHDCTQPTLHVT
jgi:hypothetical protein